VETLGAIGLSITLLGIAVRLLLVAVDKRIADAVHQRVKMATFTELLTEFREFKDEVNRSGLLNPKRRR